MLTCFMGRQTQRSVRVSMLRVNANHETEQSYSFREFPCPKTAYTLMIECVGLFYFFEAHIFLASGSPDEDKLFLLPVWCACSHRNM